MRFDYHTQYREGFALWRSPFDRNLYALLLLGLCALPWFITPFMLGEMAYIFILCVASLGLMMRIAFLLVLKFLIKDDSRRVKWLLNWNKAALLYVVVSIVVNVPNLQT